MTDNHHDHDHDHDLESLLAQAATEPAYRPAFFRALMDASVWVPGKAAREGAPVGDDAVELQHWEREDDSSVIPFFTSLQALESAVETEQPFVVMPTRALFEMTLGETLFLNAKLPTGKLFTPREITRLLGKDGDALSQHSIVEGGEALLLSEISEPPAQLIASLTTLFGTFNTVKRAFICTLKERADDAPVLLIGIEASGDEALIDSIIQAAGSVAMDTLPEDSALDICLIAEGERGISHFMLAHLTPFYERRWGSFLRDFKQNRIL